MNLRMSYIRSQTLNKKSPAPTRALTSWGLQCSFSFGRLWWGQALHSILFPSATVIANSWALLQVASLANTGAFEKFNTSKLVLWSLLKTEFCSVHKMIFGNREQKRDPERLRQSTACPQEEEGDAEATLIQAHHPERFPACTQGT